MLIDPPFEEKGDFGRMVSGLVKAHQRWPGGIYALWYPIKDPLETGAFLRGLGKSEIPSIIGAADEFGQVSGRGLVAGA